MRLLRFPSVFTTRKTLRENGSREFLCACLPAAAGDAGHLERKPVAPGSGKSLQRRQGILHLNDRKTGGQIGR